MNGDVLTFPIGLHVYDLGKKILSTHGDTIENVWYTTIVAFGREYAFSLAGIECCQPGGTIYGEPYRLEAMGDTEIPYSIFFDFMLTLSENSYRPMSYDIRRHNSTNFCDDTLQFVCGVRIPKYLLELPQDDIFTSSLEVLVMPLLKKVGPSANESSNTTSGLLPGAKSQHFLLNYIPRPARERNREPSPDLIEIQAQIEALRVDQQSLKERRAKLRHSTTPEQQNPPAIESRLDRVSAVSNSKNPVKKRSSRRKSPHPNKRDHEDKRSASAEKVRRPPKSKSSTPPAAVAEHDLNHCDDQCKTMQEQEQVLRRSISRKPSLRKRVSFDETGPVEINDSSSRPGSRQKQSTEPTAPPPLPLADIAFNQLDDGEPEEDLLPEMQEDELFSTYASLKVQCSPSPPPLFMTDLSKDERKSLKDKPIKPRDKKISRNSCSPAAAAPKPIKQVVAPPPVCKLLQPDGEKEEQEEEPREQLLQQQQKPITFRELDHMGDFEELVRDVIDLLTHEEQNRLYEMEMWIMNNEGVWVLDDTFIAFLGRLLSDTKTFSTDNRVSMLRLLAYGASQEDFSLILHMDRKIHHIMNYAHEFDRLPLPEQEALALLFSNMFETCSEWLLYISEWTLGSTNLSNVKVTTKVAVSSLLGETSSLQDYGSAIMHNFSTKDVKSVVFDDVYTELAMAILQFFHGKPSEEKVFRCLKALDKFCCLSRRDVPQLVKMIGPEPSKFGGMSSRVDDLIEKIYVHFSKI